MSATNFWQFFAGLGIFLYGMFLMEDALKQLAGRTFKLFLRKHTDNKLSAIFSGTLVTGVLQSSSVVNLMVLSFVGSGVISMHNALAVVFGSNLGTTVGSWLVAGLGFKFSIEDFAFPLIAIAGVGLILFSARKKGVEIFRFSMGFGFLFMGLGFMKESVEVVLHDFDFNAYVHLSGIGFVFLGFLITAIIQSSSATMVIALSALNTGTIPFETATAVIIGSELGTSIKILLGSIGGIVAKRRVAFGNILFNFVITVLAFLLMPYIISFIQTGLRINDPLIALVLFQTMINLGGVILFFPLLRRLGDLLEKRITEKKTTASGFIGEAQLLVPEVALEALEKETLLFIVRVIHLNRVGFRIEVDPNESPLQLKEILRKDNELRSFIERYAHVKRAEGEISYFYSKVMEEKIETQDLVRLNKLISAVRNAMYSAKGIKDIYEDRKDLRDSAVNVKYEQYKLIQSQLRAFYARVYALLEKTDKNFCYNELMQLMNQLQEDYTYQMKRIYLHSAKGAFSELDVSTLLNINREVYSSGKALIFSVRDYLLPEELSAKLEGVSPFK